MSNKKRSELWKVTTPSEAVLETEFSINDAPQKVKQKWKKVPILQSLGV